MGYDALGFAQRTAAVDAEGLRLLAARAYREFDTGRLPRRTHEEGTLWHSYEEWDGLPLDVLSAVIDLEELASVVTVVEGLVMDFAPRDVAWAWRQDHSFLRRCGRLPGSVVPWHCDAEAAGTGRLGRCVNVWLPLNEVGDGVCPSLELIAGSHAFMRDYEGAPPVDLHRPEAWVAGVPGERLAPRLSPGDALLFDHYLLHRTEPLEIYARPRLSVELRFSPEVS